MASKALTNTKIKETYVGVLHSKGAVLPSSGQEDIYDGGGNKSSIKIGRACNGVTICGPLSCSSLAIGNPIVLIDLIYPVNSIFLSTDNINPGIRFVGTTWQQASSGRFLAGVGTGDDGTNSYSVAAGNFNGKYQHTLIESEMPEHSHVGYTMVKGAGGAALTDTWPSLFDSNNVLVHQNSGHTSENISPGEEGGSLDGAVFTEDTGGGQSHNNIPPGFGVYVWKRTA